MGLFDKFQSLFHGDRVDIAERFELLREAISGTMSKFYVARDRSTDKVVGLKIGEREKVEHFESRFKGLNKPVEGSIAVQMKHPLVVPTLEHGLTTDNLPYIVMEYLQGPGLQAVLRDRDLCLEGNRHRIVKQMVEAVDYVHKAGFIHRDVCPRNFIYQPDSRSIILIDFGLTLPATRDFMQPGNRTGTPVYMAPEVIRRRWTDQRLDLFALGVSAYQVCTYELPWPGTETRGIIAVEHANTPPNDILRYRPTLNRTLAKAIMQMIQHDASDRPPTADRVASLLRGVDQDDEP